MDNKNTGALVFLIFLALGSIFILGGCKTQAAQAESEEARARREEAKARAEEKRKEREREACNKAVIEGKDKPIEIPANGKAVAVSLASQFNLAAIPPGKRVRFAVTGLPDSPVKSTESDQFAALKVD